MRKEMKLKKHTKRKSLKILYGIKFPGYVSNTMKKK